MHCMMFLLPNDLLAEHPDWFGMDDDGRRCPQGFLSPEFCWSNSEAVEVFTAQCDRVRAACESAGRDPSTMTWSIAQVLCQRGILDRRVAVALHREAATLVGSILTADQASLSALADAELARRTAVASLERGETTLAAYRRVLAPPVASATLLNRRG